MKRVHTPRTWLLVPSRCALSAGNLAHTYLWHCYPKNNLQPAHEECNGLSILVVNCKECLKCSQVVTLNRTVQASL